MEAMNTCPHCGEETVSSWRKSGATDIAPGRCNRCGGRFYVSGWVHAGAILFSDVMFWGSILAAIALQSWFPLAFIPLGWGLIIGGFYRRFALKTIGEDEICRLRRKALVQVAVLGLAIIGLWGLLG